MSTPAGTGRRPRRAALTTAVLFGVVAAACGSGSSSSSTTVASSGPSTSAATTTTTLPPGTGAATASLALRGDARVTGALTKPAVSCSFPGFDGPHITVLAGTAAPNVSTFVIVTKTGVTVRISSGSGTTYLERDFAGAGITGFDAARGVRIDASLHETSKVSGTPSAALPAATSISGTVGCGGQTTGSSTIVVSGTSVGGPVNGTLDSVRVSCSTSTLGRGVSAVGIMTVGSKRALVFVSSQPTGFTVALEPEGGPFGGFFRAQGAETSTPTASGTHVSGTAVEQNVSGRAAHTVHALGDAVCGSTGAP